MERILSIVATDPIYSHTLCEYITNSHILEYKVVEFYDLDEYEAFKSMYQIEITLLEEDLYDLYKARFKMDKDNIFLLTSERGERENAIFMYQSMDLIIKEILFRIHSSGAGTSLEGNPYEIYSVLGCRGGCGATTFAKGLAAAIGRQKNVLFVSLDPFIHMSEKEINKNSVDLLSELLYNLKIHGASWMLFAEVGHLSRFDYITGVSTFEDINDLGKEEMRSFFAGIAEDGRYQAVVLDIGRPSKSATVILEKSKKIFLVEALDDSSKKEIVESQLEKLFDEEITSKECYIKLPYEKSLAGKNATIKELEACKLIDVAEAALGENKGFTEQADYGSKKPCYDELNKNELMLMERGKYQNKKKRKLF